MENIIEFPDRSVIVDEACEWVIRMTRDELPSSDDIKALNEWIAQSPAHKEVFQELASTWSGLDLLSQLAAPAGQCSNSENSSLRLLVWWILTPVWLLARMLSKLGRGLLLVTKPKIAVAAAALALSIGISSWLILNQPATVYITSIGEQSIHTLRDGSRLRLNTDSKVEVRFTDQRRKIALLKGEAHFEVKPDRNRPFEVYAGDRMVRAVGTAFSVYLVGDEVKVVVSEGKVDLGVLTYARNNQGPLSDNLPGTLPDKKTPMPVESKSLNIKKVGSLEAGESIVIPNNSEGVPKNIVRYKEQELARRLAWTEGRLVFVGDSLEYVVKEVSRYTSVKIDVIDEEIKQLRIGGSFQVGKTEKLFDALEMGFDVRIVRLSEHHVQLFAKN